MSDRQQTEPISEAQQCIKDRFEHWRNADPTGLAARGLEWISRINSNFFHLIFELIQNADDVPYPEGQVPELKVRLATPGFIILESNQLPFTKKNVEALCDAGQSSKRGATDTTGEKGLGFKSVFRICEQVWIKSGGFSFSLNRHGLGMVRPVWVDHREFPAEVICTSGNMTTIALKLGDHDILKSRLKLKLLKDISELVPELLLFLRRLRIITIECTPSITRRLSRESLPTADTAVCKIKEDSLELRSGVWEPIGGPVTFYAVHNYLLAMPEEEHRPGQRQSRIVLAFPFTQRTVGSNVQRMPVVDKRCNVSAFLPLRETNFRFQINADWVTSTNREDIEHDSDWNVAFRDSISDCFLRSIKKFLKDPSFQFCCLKWIPQAELRSTKANSAGEIIGVPGFDSFFRPAAVDILQALKSEKVLIDTQGELQLPGDCLTIRSEFKFNGEPLVAAGAKFVHAKYSEDDFNVLRTIGCRSFGKLDFVENSKILCSDDLEDKLARSGPEWFCAFFKALKHNKGWTQPQLQRFKELKCVPVLVVSQDTAASHESRLVLKKPGDDGVFLASAIEEFQAQIDKLDRSLYFIAERAYMQSSDAEGFLVEKLGVTRAVPVNISKHLLSKHKDFHFSRSTAELKRHLKFWMRNLEDINPIELFDIVLLDTQGRTSPISSLYLDRSGVLRSILSSSSHARFLHEDFQKDRFVPFLLKIGLSELPRLQDQALSPDLALAVKNPETSLSFLFLLVTLNHDQPELIQTYMSCPTFITAVKEMSVPCCDGIWRPLKETFFRSKALADEPDLPFIDIESSLAKIYKKILTKFGVSFTVNLDHCLKLLSSLSKKHMKDVTSIRALYKKIDRECTADQVSILRDAFDNEPLLFLPKSETWTKVKDNDSIYWSTSITLPFEKLGIVQLIASYDDLESLFRKKLRVENFLIKHSGVVLKRVLGEAREGRSQPKNLNREEMEIINRILNDLSRMHRDDPTVEKPWLREICKSPIYIVRHVGSDIGLPSHNNGNLYIGDDIQAVRLFQDDERVQILDIEDSLRPLREHLIQYVNSLGDSPPIRKLSECIQRRQWTDGILRPDAQQTKDLRRHRRDIARFVYNQEPQIQIEECIKKLLHATVSCADTIYEELSIETSAGVVSKSRPGSYCMHSFDADGHFNIVVSANENDDLQEIRYQNLLLSTYNECLGGSGALREFLKEIWRKDPMKIEIYLASRSIGLLPTELAAQFDRQDELDGNLFIGDAQEEESDFEENSVDKAEPPTLEMVKQEMIERVLSNDALDYDEIEVVDKIPDSTQSIRYWGLHGQADRPVSIASNSLSSDVDDEAQKVPHLDDRREEMQTHINATSGQIVRMHEAKAVREVKNGEEMIEGQDPDEARQFAPATFEQFFRPASVDRDLEGALRERSKTPCPVLPSSSQLFREREEESVDALAGENNTTSPWYEHDAGAEWRPHKRARLDTDGRSNVEDNEVDEDDAEDEDESGDTPSTTDTISPDSDPDSESGRLLHILRDKLATLISILDDPDVILSTTQARKAIAEADQWERILRGQVIAVTNNGAA